MAFTYTGLLDTALDRIRFVLGDTVSATAFLTDAEITAVVALTTSEGWAAVACCESIIARVAKQVTFSVGGLSKSASELMTHYKDLLKTLTAKAASGADLIGAPATSVPTPDFGGISHSDNVALRQDSDLIQPTFRKGGDDIPGGGNPSLDGAWWDDPFRR